MVGQSRSPLLVQLPVNTTPTLTHGNHGSSTPASTPASTAITGRLTNVASMCLTMAQQQPSILYKYTAIAVGVTRAPDHIPS